ncbi:hypothetical protein BDV93DRAFT_512936 [Ceratobasidium sp. AG-I]|nr:hypothetical protein BDV93DRAFT_512936 [Ceratobasidium sp. AG-I]
MRGLNEPAEIEMEKILYVLWYKLVRPILDYLGYTSNVSKLRSPSGAPQSCGGEVGGTPERSQSVERTGNTHSLLQLSGAPGESTDFAKKLPVHQLPHITWCSTGALTFLPIHAAGNYDSEGEHIFDFAVTSYTPTLTALLPAPSQPSVDTPGLLVVGQKFTTGYLNLPGVVSELASIKRHVAGLPLMILEDSQATPEAVLKSMDKYSCVHLACHATQNIEAPTESGFHLHTGILSLEVIAQQSLKNKGLAFLSACGTAAGDLKLPDEAIHLATGMLVAGYPSVIATMWSIDDRDAALLADSVYGELMKGGKLDCSQAARALHAATGALRVKVGERAFTRWAPFIHIGQ